ncbi:hypothetical protein SODALDRAFT_326316 [Sodiomyces alkalinus F11]|uniref:Uncharacterized protein n=1 Tax=Sodiomyces alkalinus (strain CBS 110278 / VKM F-3762 / F11) TaxID=1314773 RepID=A0A3N2Q5Y6_SODAK|nr:hypothetical protein SODALDRAFT_326316 [Sodiomyces alkalinus F11]ROT42150.1 hypothetical protein SODALDRAFT_326316 [Sodiomyces alkalinus F11]
MSMSWFTDDDQDVFIPPHSPLPVQENSGEMNSNMHSEATRPSRNIHALQELSDYHDALRDVSTRPTVRRTPGNRQESANRPSTHSIARRELKESRALKESRPSKSHSTIISNTTLHPPPTKPLPPVPRPRLPSKGTIDTSPTSPTISSTPDHWTSRAPRGTGTLVSAASPGGESWTASSRESRLTPLTLGSLAESLASPITIPHVEPGLEPRPLPPTQAQAQPQTQVTPRIDVVPSKRLSHNNKDRGSISYIDVSPSSTILASKQGNHMIRLWDVPQETLASTIKVRFYVQTQPRSRDYFVRSHAILSETAALIAIATAFGHTLEIWNWSKSKKLQTIDDAYRWASARGDIFQANWPSLATYREDRDTIDLYPLRQARADKPFDKPFDKPRTIDLRLTGLPHVPKCPELAYSATGPLLIAAAGPRTPRPGHPPPEHGPMLIAWEVDDVASPSHKPYKFIMPAAHADLAMALPFCLVTYGSVAVSIWIPAAYRLVEGKGKTGGGSRLEPAPVTARHVLLWDFSANTAWTYAIPDAVACVSPDCRFVAYCCDHKAGVAILDAMTGRELCWLHVGKEEESIHSSDGSSVLSRVSGGSSEQSKGAHQITELCFSADGSLFYVGDGAGSVRVYHIKEPQREDMLRPGMPVDTCIESSNGGIEKSLFMV